MNDTEITIIRMTYFEPDATGDSKVEYFENGYALNDFINKMKKVAKKNHRDFIYRLSTFKCVDR